MLAKAMDHKIITLVVFLAVGALLTAVVLPMALSADRHEINNNIDADGYWSGLVGPGSAQNWTFTTTEDRLQVIRVSNIQPAGATLNVTIGGQDLGPVTGEGEAGASLPPGSHTVTFSNPGDSTVTYDFYLGNVSLSMSPTTRTVGPGEGNATFSIVANNSQILFGVTVTYTGPFPHSFPRQLAKECRST